MGKLPPSILQDPRESETKRTKSGLDELLAHRQIWQASTVEDRRSLGLDTGHEALNELLPDEGWPRDGLAEIITDRRGIGELRLLMPALAELSREENRWIAWIRSPHIPYAPALEACGIDTSKVLLVHPRSHKDTLWTMEQALKTGTCAAVLAWPDPRQLEARDIRRLQLAAKQGRTLGLMFRPEESMHDASPAELRIQIRSPREGAGEAQMVEIRIVKRRGGWPTEFFPLELDISVTGTRAKTLVEQLWLWRKLRITACREPGRTDSRVILPEKEPAPVERPAVSTAERSNTRLVH
jgi:hypothetical protein